MSDALPSLQYTLELPTRKVFVIISTKDDVPWALFIVSKDLSDTLLDVVLARFVSYMLQHGTPVKDVCTELSSITDPQGGYVYKAQWFSSWPAHLAQLLNGNKRIPVERICPMCNTTMKSDSGCFTCVNCDYSKCGD